MSSSELILEAARGGTELGHLLGWIPVPDTGLVRYSCEMRPSYVEVSPCAALAPWVQCYWTIQGTGVKPVPHRVLPDGCADVIIDLSGARGPYPFAVGAMRRALVSQIGGSVDLLGVRFRPGAAMPFFDVPLREVSDQQVALDALWGGMAATLADAVASAPVAARVACVERELLRRVRLVRRDEPAVRRAVAMLERSGGRSTLRELTAAVGVGERWLERAFDRCVGLSPKGFARVVRFREALRRLQAGVPTSWTKIAFASGYADQPHFVREFKALAGLTPVAFMAEQRRVGIIQDSGEVAG